eukprot:CAMPEP_0198281752 /NCGR_PEP_ID=MMETSP1449-20131203/1632_1 /TAXON_ID=420275 /ORGANISM="Attheya septentrionalis, Strain CCMP2084" /LENGTH=670 /DNA_ID=CAMNT_0043977655 /DNA_START=149 /DNA_END=2161 /DNA_ORIENTATION=-
MHVSVFFWMIVVGQEQITTAWTIPAFMPVTCLQSRITTTMQQRGVRLASSLVSSDGMSLTTEHEDHSPNRMWKPPQSHPTNDTQVIQASRQQYDLIHPRNEQTQTWMEQERIRELTLPTVQGMAQTMALSKATAKAEATARAHLEAMLSLTHQQQSYSYQNNHDTNIESLPNNAVVPNSNEKTKGESPHDLDTTLTTAPIHTTDSHKHSEDSSSSFHGLEERSLQKMGFLSSYANALSSLLPSTRQVEFEFESLNDKNGNGYSYLETLSHRQQKKPPSHSNTNSEFQSVQDEIDEPLVPPLSPSFVLEENPSVEHNHHRNVLVSHGEEEEASSVVSYVQKKMTTGPFGDLDFLAMPPTVSCGEGISSQGHSLESPSVAKSSPPLVSHHEPMHSIATNDEHDEETRNGILSEPTSRSVKQYPVSAGSVMAESRSSSASLSFVSLEGTETRRPKNLLEKESVQNAASAKVSTTMVESSSGLSSFSYLDSLHRPSSQIMTANHASPPKGYLDSLEVSSSSSSTFASWKWRLLVKAWVRVMVQCGSVVRRNDENASMTRIQKRAREAVVQANQVATRLEQTAVQKEARAKAALAQVSTIQQVVAMEQQPQMKDVTQWSHAVTQHRRDFRRHMKQKQQRRSLSKNKNNKTPILIQSAVILIGQFLVDLILRMGLL